MNNQQLWQAVLGNLEVNMSKGYFTTWFKNTSVLEQGENYLTISVPNAYSKTWIASKHQLEILRTLKTIAPEIRELRYEIGANKTPGSQMPNNTVKAPQATLGSHKSGLNPAYVFDTFVTGKTNELAHAASVAVSKNPGGQYNPLFIYGGVGLGKTHLMHAVGNSLCNQKPGAKVLYVTSEKFTNDYINALAQKKMDDFKHLYRNVDMLLIDDIQFIAGKESTQEEFFHTFNELRDKGKQIIMTSDRLPKDIPAIEQRLVSRFEWGMIADIQAPDLETRLAILRTKLTKKGVTMDERIMNYIAENIVSNIRELEGALNRLLVYQEMESRTLDYDQAVSLLVNVVNQKKKTTTLKKIAMSVAEFYNITVEDLIKQSRRKEYVRPRQIAMYLSRKELASSFPTIGEFYGGRDHTTVMHGVEKVEGMVSNNESLKQELDLITNKLYLA